MNLIFMSYVQTLRRCVGLEPERQYAGNGGVTCSDVEQDS
jgi:hypothetical protein